MSNEIEAPELLTKHADERRQYSMDFSADMTSAETIEESSPSPAVTSTLRGGGTSDLTIDTIAVSGQTVTFWVDGGTDHKRYRIKVAITTSSGQELVGIGKLEVKE